jgi:hypothetical protein
VPRGRVRVAVVEVVEEVGNEFGNKVRNEVGKGGG